MQFNEKTIEEIRKDLHRHIDNICDGILAELNGAQYAGDGLEGIRLLNNAGRFKGTKPKAVLFPDGRKISVRKWKEVVAALLADCITDQNRLNYLLGIRGRVFGKQRLILANSPSGMAQPMQICDQLWMETKYDTETLLRVLMFRIFDVVGYDYSGIRIMLREDGVRHVVSE